MTFPIIVERADGSYTASLLGSTAVRAVGATPDQAIESLRETIAARVAQGELSSLEIAAPSLSDLAGKYADDPTLREICETAYRERDLQSAK